jgi:two-component system chemotaxis sensor kinase CheA
MDPMAAIKQTFFQECDEQLSELEAGLLRMEGGDHDPETINAVFRAVHSVKGGASAFGFDDLVEFVHVFETTLDLLRSNKLTPSQTITGVLLRASDALSDLVTAAREGGGADAGKVASMKAELSGLCQEAAPAEGGAEQADDPFEFVPVAISFDDIFGGEEQSEAPKGFKISFKPEASLYAKANETVRLFKQLSQLGALRTVCDVSHLPLLPELDPEGAYFSWTIELETAAPLSAVQEVFEFVTGDCELSIAPLEGAAPMEPAPMDPPPEPDPPPPPPTGGEPIKAKKPDIPMPELPQTKQTGGKTEQAGVPQKASIRVDLDKVDKLIDLVGELVINQAMLSQRVSEAGLSRATSVMIGLGELEQLTRDIQDSVMAIRAQPVKAIFQRMSRVVREVASMTKKSVRLVTEGEGTEVDKTVIEKLTDPLTHMIRNSVGHGIESPEARLAAGKPEEGVLRLSASHRSGRIVIEITDDGAGINRPRVRSIAVNKGLIPPDAVLTDEEIDNLIFLPGFSTAETASAISGRGVGMDVVKRAIQALRGRISIVSRPGKGSTFSMSLPLTLAVLDGMVVTVADQTFVVPLTTIIETLQPRPENVHVIGGGLRVIRNRDSFIPVVDVGCLLRYRAQDVDPSTQVALLAESESGGRCAMLVDAIQGQRQVVIKSLENNYGHVHGVAAATILGDGRVALIIDVDAIINGLRAEFLTSEPALAAE